MSKAFDKVWHEELLHKLKQNGIPGNSKLRPPITRKTSKTKCQMDDSLFKYILNEEALPSMKLPTF